MMGIETIKMSAPKTVDRNTLVQRSSIQLDTCGTARGQAEGVHQADQKSLLLSGRENCGENHLRRDGHNNGRLSGTLSERSLIYEQSESFRPVLWTSD